MDKLVKCDICGKTFVAHNIKTKRCSKECGMIAVKNKRKAVTKEKIIEKFGSIEGECVVCGKRFERTTINHLCCSDKCTAENNRVKARDRWHDKDFKTKTGRDPAPRLVTRKEKESNQDKIKRLNKEAKDHGMSYGQWVALEYIRKEREKNEIF